MACPHCRTAAPAGARFCPGCGRPLPRPCTRCGTDNAADHRFCKSCGAPLGLGLGLVERDAGKAEAARTALSAAIAAFRTIGVPFWAAQAEAALSGR